MDQPLNPEPEGRAQRLYDALEQAFVQEARGLARLLASKEATGQRGQSLEGLGLAGAVDKPGPRIRDFLGGAAAGPLWATIRKNGTGLWQLGSLAPFLRRKGK